MRLNGKLFIVLLVAGLALFSYAIVKINPGDEFRRNVPEGGGSAVPGTAPVSPANPAPGVSEPNPAAPAKPAPSEGSRKVEVLREILAAKNDNDPRLDSEFRQMSAETKEELRSYYAALPPEQLNSKGTVVFLLGRDLKGGEDADFLASVLTERPCLSFDRCSAEPKGESHEADITSEVTLAYPQIVAAKSLSKAWNRIQDPRRKEALSRALEQAARSENAALARTAQETLAQIQSS